MVYRFRQAGAPEHPIWGAARTAANVISMSTSPGQPSPVGEGSQSVANHPAQPATPRATDVAIAVIAHEGRVLICQRPTGASFAGFWEFPGGKREGNETVSQCLVREVREELAIEVEPVHALRPVDHDYPRGRIRLHPYVCTHLGGEPQLLASQAVKWVTPLDLRQHTFPPANDELIEDVIAHLTRKVL